VFVAVTTGTVLVDGVAGKLTPSTWVTDTDVEPAEEERSPLKAGNCEPKTPGPKSWMLASPEPVTEVMNLPTICVPSGTLAEVVVPLSCP
jgi:hypothetical protein